MKATLSSVVFFLSLISSGIMVAFAAPNNDIYLPAIYRQIPPTPTATPKPEPTPLPYLRDGYYEALLDGGKAWFTIVNSGTRAEGAAYYFSNYLCASVRSFPGSEDRSDNGSFEFLIIDYDFRHIEYEFLISPTSSTSASIQVWDHTYSGIGCWANGTAARQ